MRFMILVKATPATEAGVMPEDALMATMAAYHEQLAQAGVLLDAAGLQPSAKGWRVRYQAVGRAGERTISRTVRAGPFANTDALVAGYTVIEVPSKEIALEWSRRFPAPHGDAVDAEIEVRPLFEFEDVGPDAASNPFRAIGVAAGAQEG